jgi:methylmalonyl-CoA mutase
VQDSLLRRRALIRGRERTIVGVNAFPAVGEAAMPDAAEDDAARSTRTWPIRALEAPRDAEPYEELREKARSLAEPPTVRIALVGAPAKAKAREAFARAFFEVGGFQVVAGDAPADAVVLAGTDDAYQSAAEAAVVAAKEAGARAIVLAGKPGDLEAALRAAGLTDAIHLGIDVPSVAGAILDRVIAGRKGAR